MLLLLIPAAALFLLIRSRGAFYQKLASEEHLQELIHLAADLFQEGPDPVQHTTSAKILLEGRLSPKGEDQYQALLSISSRKGFLLPVYAGFFADLVRRSLGVEATLEALGRSGDSVYHFALTLPSLPNPQLLVLSPALLEECGQAGRLLEPALRRRLEAPPS